MGIPHNVNAPHLREKAGQLRTGDNRIDKGRKTESSYKKEIRNSGVASGVYKKRSKNEYYEVSTKAVLHTGFHIDLRQKENSFHSADRE